MTTADTILTRLEPLTYDARMREIVALDRAGRDDTDLVAALADLEARGFYERHLALMSCYGSGDGVHALRALADPSRLLRGLAIALVPRVCDDAQAVRALATLQPQDRRRLAKRLWLKRRLDPIDAVLGRLAADGDTRQLADLLPFGSRDAVAAHLPQVQDSASRTLWVRLARLHPDMAVETLSARVAGMDDDDPRLLWQINAVAPILAQSRPDATLALAASLDGRVSLRNLGAALTPLLMRRPAAVVDVVLRADDDVALPLERVAHRLDAGRLIAALERMPEARWAVADRFRRLRPEVRAAVFTAGERGWRDGGGAVAIETLRDLPAALRVPEARRHLALPALATRPLQRLPYAGLLPWDEARALLTPAIGSPDPDLRAAALAALTATVRYERGRAGEILALVHARRNEQDPVRLAMLAGLAGLPPGTWRAPQLADLGATIRDALDAADLSGGTAAQAGRLVASLFPFHPAWAAEWMAALVRERGDLPVDNLEGRLTDADIARVAPILLPVLRSWETRERESYVRRVAVSLGRRLRLFDELGEILGRIAATTLSSYTADHALRLLSRWQPERFHALVPALLREDESVVTLGSVWSYLSRRRQDLLTPYLGQRAYRGRFATGQTRIALPFSDGFHRWTPAQQAIFAATLREITGRDPTMRDTPAILRGIAQLSGLQAVPPAQLIRLARRENEHLAVRDAALRALGKLDDVTEAVPVLLGAMDDDRARVAVYALRRALRAMPVDQAVAILRTVPLDRVTVAKEVARLYGDLPGPRAFDQLRELSRRELHRDVRVALLRALWGRLEQPEAWALLEDAARSPDPTLARSVMRLPDDGLSPAGQRRLVALLARLLEHPDPVVRLDVAWRCAALPVADPDRVLLARLLTLLRSPLRDERDAAAGAVVAMAVERDAARIGATVAALLPDRRAILTFMDKLTVAAGGERARPSHGRRALAPITRPVVAASGGRSRLLPVVHVVLDALATDRLTSSLQIRLAARALPWDEVGALLLRLAAAGDLHSDALSAACQEFTAARATLRRDEASDLAALDERFGVSPDRYVRRLGLAALVGLARSARGWDADRLARLNAYRGDPAALVAAAAQFTLPAEELAAE